MTSQKMKNGVMLLYVNISSFYAVLCLFQPFSVTTRGRRVTTLRPRVTFIVQRYKKRVPTVKSSAKKCVCKYQKIVHFNFSPFQFFTKLSNCQTLKMSLRAILSVLGSIYKKRHLKTNSIYIIYNIYTV